VNDAPNTKLSGFVPQASECFLFDTTNDFTYMASNTESDLTKCGKNKEGRDWLRQVAMALLVDRKNRLPFFYREYEGNHHDSKVFQSIMDEVLVAIRERGQQNVVIVFDKGMDSADNISAIDAAASGVNFITTYFPYFADELIHIDRKRFDKQNLPQFFTDCAARQPISVVRHLAASPDIPADIADASGLFKNNGQFRQHIFHNIRWNAFQTLAFPGFDIQRAGLVTTDNAICPGARSGKRHGKPGRPGKVSAAGDGQNHGCLSYLVKCSGGNNKDRARSALLMPFSRTQGHKINIPALHYSNSLPTAAEVVHSLSCGEVSAVASHCSRSSRSVYRRRFAPITMRPSSTASSTVVPARRLSRSRTAGGTANITEPPTLRRWVVCISFSP
jgi:hypothetical protein